MPRPSKGPRLALQKARGRQPVWIIRDGQRTLGTGCDEGDRRGAERKLAAYILKKHDPKKAIGNSDPNGVKIADALSVEMTRVTASAMPAFRKRELINVCENMGDWFGDRTVGELDGDIQRAYAEQRGFPAAAYRDLKILAAAINRHIKNKVGGVQAKFRPVLPAPSKPRA
jgi:hypothetical protein